MISGGIERHFLGWDKPVLPLVVDWLAARRDLLPEMLVVVPTSGGGRRLREALAERLGGVLSPMVATPGALLREAAADTVAAADWLEVLAWRAVLLEFRDWDSLADALPVPPDGTERETWATGLARQFAEVRRALQENGLRMAGAARLMAGSPEAERWQALARLEEAVEGWLRRFGRVSRSEVLSRAVAGGCVAGERRMIVLAGVPDMAPLVERILEAAGVPVVVLIAAPESEAENFNKLGRPLAAWTTRVFPWPSGPSGSVVLSADPREQARVVAEALAAGGRASDAVAVGSADAETGEEIVRELGAHGWLCFHPAAPPRVTVLRRFLQAWAAWLADARLGVVQDLLALPQSDVFTGGSGRRTWLAGKLSMLRERWLADRAEDLEQWLEDESLGRPDERAAAEDVLKLARGLQAWRGRMRREGFSAAMEALLTAVAELDRSWADEASRAIEVLRDFAEAPEGGQAPDAVWLDLLFEAMPEQMARPPEGRVLDVQGWLELFHEPGEHLVIAGMNEGGVPARADSDPWLGEGARRALGLTHDATRAARDAYLLHAMCAARAEGGRVDLICGKTSADGNPLLPSRLLLAAAPDDLPARVRVLFAGIEPPEAGLRQERDWQWSPRRAAVPQRLSATGLADYLRCPFRFYLKHVLRLSANEPDRGEWNARDFGNITHAVLETWGRDEAARDAEDPEDLFAYVNARLEHEVARRFGTRPPLAVRLQIEAMRQRLRWFAEAQAETRAEGWRVHAIERKIEVERDGLVVVGKIDRVDFHADERRWRVIDYKTGKVKSVREAHLASISKLPAHLDGTPGVFEREVPAAKGSTKTVRHVWMNLQLPFYAETWARDHEGEVELAYFPLPPKRGGTGVAVWDGFGEAERASAAACVGHVLARVREGMFWPPAEKPQYDDFAMLAADGLMEETTLPPEQWRETAPAAEDTDIAEVADDAGDDADDSDEEEDNE